MVQGSEVHGKYNLELLNPKHAFTLMLKFLRDSDEYERTFNFLSV